MLIGLAGYGYWGQRHARVLSGLPGVELRIFDPDPVARRAARAHHPSAYISHGGANEFNGLDALIVAAPPRAHVEVALAALRAGCHVLIEKPMALTVTDAEAMVETAFAAQRTLMVGHIYDYHPDLDRARGFVRSGLVGSMRHVRSTRTNLGMHRKDVNVMWDLAPHDVAIINGLVGGPPDVVSAWLGDHAGWGVADEALLRLEYRRQGVVATVEVSWLHPRRVRELVISGSKGWLVFDEADEVCAVRFHQSTSMHRSGPVPGAALDETVVEGGGRLGLKVEPLRVEIEHFVDCIRSGRQPRSNGISGLDVVRVLVAAAEAAQAGRPVALAPYEPTGLLL